MVIIAQRRRKTTSEFEFQDHIFLTKGWVQATALGLRLDIAVFADYLSLLQRARSADRKIEIDLQKARNECDHLVREAARHNRLVQQVEGHGFLAQL